MKYLKLSEKCKQVQQDLEKESEDYLFNRQCCQTVTENSNTQKAQNVCDVCVNYKQSQPFFGKGCGIFDISDMDVVSVHQNLHCTEVMPNYNVNEHISCCCKQRPISFMKESKLFMKHTDPLVENDAKNYFKNTCENIRLRKKLGWNLSVDIESLTEGLQYKSYSNFTGLKCQTNKTLKFYAMDTKHSNVFPKSLGVSLGSSKNETKIVIVDKLVRQLLQTFVIFVSYKLNLETVRRPTSGIDNLLTCNIIDLLVLNQSGHLHIILCACSPINLC